MIRNLCIFSRAWLSGKPPSEDASQIALASYPASMRQALPKWFRV